jgi:hypothetical protein
VTAYTQARAHVERAETRKPEPLIHGPRHRSSAVGSSFSILRCTVAEVAKIS